MYFVNYLAHCDCSVFVSLFHCLNVWCFVWLIVIVWCLFVSMCGALFDGQVQVMLCTMRPLSYEFVLKFLLKY